MARIIEAKAVISAKDATGAVFEAVAKRLEKLSKQADAASRRSAGAAQRAAAASTRAETIERAAPVARRNVGAIAAQAARQTAGVGAGMVGLPALGAAGAVYGGVQSYKRFGESELAVKRIGITADASDAEIKKLDGSLRGLAFETAQSFDGLKDGLESLVSGGMDLDKAMPALPAIAKTAQAAGAEVKDMATTTLALNQALGISSDKMQGAFDALVTAGKAGKFELKDMARYLPSILPAAKAVGLQGQEGLEKIAALMQTIRAGTGTTEEAASSLQNVFAKMESETTTNKFKEFGVDLRKEMEKARAGGKDLLSTFIELTKTATKGDLSKIPQLFSDMEFARGMRALLQYQNVYDDVMARQKKAAGATARDLDRVMQSPQMALNRLAQSWDNLKTSIGATIEQMGVARALHATSKALDEGRQINDMPPEERAQFDAEKRRKESLDPQIIALRQEIDALEKGPNAANRATDKIGLTSQKQRDDALTMKRLKLFDLERGRDVDDQQKLIFGETLTKAIKDAEETRRLFKEFEAEITKTPAQLKDDAARVRVEGEMRWDKSRSPEATAARAGEANILDLPEALKPSAQSDNMEEVERERQRDAPVPRPKFNFSEREAEVMEEVERERQRGKALTDMNADRYRRPDVRERDDTVSIVEKPKLPGGMTHGWELPRQEPSAQRDLSAAPAGPVTAQLTGSGDLAGKIDVNVKVEAGSTLIAIEQSVKNLIATVTGRFNAGNGPGSVGKSSPDAAAPNVGKSF